MCVWVGATPCTGRACGGLPGAGGGSPFLSPLSLHDAHSSTTLTYTHLPEGASGLVPRSLMHLPQSDSLSNDEEGSACGGSKGGGEGGGGSGSQRW